jgi:hypothetical protein
MPKEISNRLYKELEIENINMFLNTEADFKTINQELGLPEEETSENIEQKSYNHTISERVELFMNKQSVFKKSISTDVRKHPDFKKVKVNSNQKMFNSSSEFNFSARVALNFSKIHKSKDKLNNEETDIELSVNLGSLFREKKPFRPTFMGPAGKNLKTNVKQ